MDNFYKCYKCYKCYKRYKCYYRMAINKKVGHTLSNDIERLSNGYRMAYRMKCALLYYRQSLPLGGGWRHSILQSYEGWKGQNLQYYIRKITQVQNTSKKTIFPFRSNALSWRILEYAWSATASQTRYSTKTCSKTLRHKSTNLTKALSHVPVYEGGFISWMQVHSFRISIGLRKSGPPNLQFSSDKCFSKAKAKDQPWKGLHRLAARTQQNF